MARETYTHGHDAAVLAAHGVRTATDSAPHLLAHLAPGLDLLDVGCGPATITADLAAAVAPGRVVAVDAAAEAVEAARATVAARGVDVEVRVGDVYALGEPDGAFDVVHAHQVLQHLADPVAALVEMRRVCRPGGVVAVRDADYAGFFWTPRPAGLDRWIELYHPVARANGGEPDAGRRLPTWARAAGFDDVVVTGSCWVFAAPADRARWAGQWARRTAPGSRFAVQVLDRGLASLAEVAEVAGAWQVWAEAEDALFVVPHVELVCRA
ncbi:MAG: methyltransferase domain-containing protein [Acidimicrobiia bacterium]